MKIRYLTSVVALSGLLALAGCSDEDGPLLPDGGISLPEASVCSSSNCSGCCTTGGACIIIQSNENCGAGGKLCQKCATGKVCYQKACTTGSTKCTPRNCKGCCQADKCVAGTSGSTCGKGGLPCKACGSTQVCNSLGACACDSTTCSGCCANNSCKPGTDSNFCGKSGNTCTACKSGETCVAGQCKTGVTCDATTCSGCCQGGQCKAGTDVAACGKAGNTCKACKTGEQCISGTCVDTKKCSPTSCASGCCDGSTCEKGTSSSACGTGGAPCQTCKSGENCTAGKCINPSCGPTSCPSGCCKSGKCETGTSSSACGTGGKSCEICKSYQSCSSGLCAVNSTSKWAISVISAKINSAKNWDSWPANVAPDAYVTVTVGTTNGKTSVQSNKYTPYWNDLVLTTTAYNIKNYKLNVTVWDDDLPLDEKIGQCTLTVKESVLVSGSGVSTCGNDVTDLRFKFTPN